MMALIRRLLHVDMADTSQLKAEAEEQRQLVRLARAERRDMIFKTLIAEVRK